jgi:hypothetical protein
MVVISIPLYNSSFAEGILYINAYRQQKKRNSLLRQGADKSLAQPTSWCRRTESIVSLERRVCSCANCKTASSSLIIFQRTKLSNAQYCSSLLVQLKDIVKEKRHGMSPRGSCSGTTMPQLTGHLQPCRNWPTNVLLTHPYSPDLALSDYHLFPGLKKNN